MECTKSSSSKEMQSAMKETVDKSLLDAEDNVMEFYNSPEGAYKRTGQLGNSRKEKCLEVPIVFPEKSD